MSMTRFLLDPRKLLLRGLLCLTLGVGLSTVADRALAQQEPPPPRITQALESLLGSLGPGEVLEAGPETVRARVVVRRNESLEAVIRRSLGELPGREKALRNAFIEVNPQAFPGGVVRRMAAGTELMVPAVADLRRHLQPSPMPPPAMSASAAASKPAPPSAPAGPDKKHWVRFP